MTQKKLLSRKQFDLLMKLSDERLGLVLSTLMTDVFQLAEEDLLKLVKAQTRDAFEKRLREIRNRLSGEDFSLLERSVLYSISKLFGHLDFKKSDRALLKKELLFLIDKVIVPSIRMILYYRESGVIGDREYASLREALFDALSPHESGKARFP